MDMTTIPRHRLVLQIVLLLISTCFLAWWFIRQDENPLLRAVKNFHRNGTNSIGADHIMGITNPEENSSTIALVGRINDTDPVSLTRVDPDEIYQVASTLARAFTVWNASSTPYNWCVPAPDGDETEGLLFGKLPKCASTTGLGITSRIADVIGRRLYSSVNQTNANNTDPPITVSCSTQAEHSFLRKKRIYGRNKEKSLAWTQIRDPGRRSLSQYFHFDVSRKHMENVTEEMILSYLRKNHHVLFKRLRMEKPNKAAKDTPDDEAHDNKDNTTNQPIDEHTQKLNDIKDMIEFYDFISLVERMPESLVVFSMIARVPLADVIVLPSKLSGHDSQIGCELITPSWTTPNIDQYLANEYITENWYDYIIYQAVNISLDLTIEALGQKLVQTKLDEFHALMKKNELGCYDKAIRTCACGKQDNKTQKCQQGRGTETLLPEQQCYFHDDAGCGHFCTDAVLRNESESEWDHLYSYSQSPND